MLPAAGGRNRDAKDVDGFGVEYGSVEDEATEALSLSFVGGVGDRDERNPSAATEYRIMYSKW